MALEMVPMFDLIASDYGTDLDPAVSGILPKPGIKILDLSPFAKHLRLICQHGVNWLRAYARPYQRLHAPECVR
jgi:hypothetical protein